MRSLVDSAARPHGARHQPLPALEDVVGQERGVELDDDVRHPEARRGEVDVEAGALAPPPLVVHQEQQPRVPPPAWLGARSGYENPLGA